AEPPHTLPRAPIPPPAPPPPAPPPPRSPPSPPAASLHALAAAIGLHPGGVAGADVREGRVVSRGRARTRFGNSAGWPVHLLGAAAPATALAGVATRSIPTPTRPIPPSPAASCATTIRSVGGPAAVRTAIATGDIGTAARPVGRAATARIEHPLAFLAAEVLPRRLAPLHIGLGEFVAHVGVVVFHAVAVVGVVLPVGEVIAVVAIDIVDVDVLVEHVDVVTAPVAVAPAPIADGEAGAEC